MEFLSLLMVASMPMLEILLAGLLGAFLASGSINILTADARRDINKIVFVVFIPALVFACLAKTATLEDIISWWFMPVNVGLTFLIGSVLGWLAVKILKPEAHLEGLIIACCSAGNLGTLPLIILPAVCNEEGNPFGEAETCRAQGLTYASLSTAVGNLFTWTYTNSLLMNSARIYHAKYRRDGSLPEVTEKNHEVRGENGITKAMGAHGIQESLLLPSYKQNEQATTGKRPRVLQVKTMLYIWEKLKQNLQKSGKEILSPPTVAAMAGFVVGVVPWLKALIVGESAPLRVIQDSMTLLGDGTVPCTILILGGNLTEGLRKSALKPTITIAVICVRFVILPLFGIGVVVAAGNLGYLPQSPLFSYALLIQFTVPSGMSIGTMAQLFDVCKEESSVILVWAYMVAAFALTIWSMVFMWILF